MLYANNDIFTTSLLICIPLTSFYCFIILVMTSGSMLNGSDEGERPCLAPDLERKACRLSHGCDGSCRAAVAVVCWAKEVPFYSQFAEFLFFLNHGKLFTYVKCFSASIKVIIRFLLFIYESGILRQLTLDVKQTCIPRINLTCSWCLNIFMCCWT